VSQESIRRKRFVCAPRTPNVRRSGLSRGPFDAHRFDVGRSAGFVITWALAMAAACFAAVPISQRLVAIVTNQCAHACEFSSGPFPSA
jgi:hypothetical protein